ncbi:MBL fold metallo-hydrolase [Nonomuraea sp. NPDC049400]
MDPSEIKYVVVAHGHSDHFGGATSSPTGTALES